MVIEHAQPRKKKFSFAVLFLLIILFGLSFCTLKTYRAYKEFPEWAERSVVFAEYATTINIAQAEIDQATSQFDLAARIEKSSLAQSVLYLEINPASDEDPFVEELVVIGKETYGSKSHFMKHGAGYGNLDSLETVVVELEVEKLAEVESVVFHISRP